MSSQEKIVSSLLNTAQPNLKDGWEAADVGSGELAVRNVGLKRYVILPIEAEALLPLLDGTRTLNDVAAELLRRTGRVRHQMILDAVARLRASGMLEPLEGQVDEFLLSQFRVKGGRKLLRLVSRISYFRILVPFRFNGKAILSPSSKGVRYLSLAVLLLYLSSLVPMLRWAFGGAADHRMFGATPVAALGLIIVGMLLAISLKEILKFLLLLLMSRVVHGKGVAFTMGLPHIAVDSTDGVMLNREGRITYRAWNLAAICLVPLVASIFYWSMGGMRWLYVALGGHLALLFSLSPLWPSDFSAWLEEVLGSRSLRRSSRKYLLKKLWHNVFQKGSLGRQELQMMIFASAWILYLFLAAGVLSWLAPGTVDAISSALLSPATPVIQLVLAIVIAVYLWLALIFFFLGIIAAVLALLAQLATSGKKQDKPIEVKQAESLDLHQVAEELKSVPPFSAFPAEFVEETLSGGRVETYRAGTSIIRQGDPGDTCYALRTGECAVILEEASGDTREFARLHPGHLFGEIALLTSAPRQASVVVTADCEVIAIDRSSFMELVEKGGHEAEEIIENVRIHLFLKSIELLRGVSAVGMAELMNSFSLVRKSNGEDVVRAGDVGDTMYVIYKGSCDVVGADGSSVAVLKEGDYFGEIALVTGSKRSATVKCREDSVLVELPAQVYQDVIVREFSTGVLLDQEVESRLEELSLS